MSLPYPLSKLWRQLRTQPNQPTLKWLKDNTNTEDFGGDPATKLWEQKYRQVGAYTDGRATITCFMGGYLNRLGWASMFEMPIWLLLGGVVVLFNPVLGMVFGGIGILAGAIGLTLIATVRYREAWVVYEDEKGVQTFVDVYDGFRF